jgi:hypothetical protein
MTGITSLHDVATTAGTLGYISSPSASLSDQALSHDSQNRTVKDAKLRLYRGFTPYLWLRTVRFMRTMRHRSRRYELLRYGADNPFDSDIHHVVFEGVTR